MILDGDTEGNAEAWDVSIPSQALLTKCIFLLIDSRRVECESIYKASGCSNSTTVGIFPSKVRPLCLTLGSFYIYIYVYIHKHI